MATPLLTIEEAGSELGVSRSTVWRLIKRGELGRVRRSGRRLVHVASGRARALRPATRQIAPIAEDHPIPTDQQSSIAPLTVITNRQLKLKR